MRLFIKEHSLLIAVQAIQVGVILSTFWLDGYRDIKLFFYAAFLGFFFLSCYLIFHYVTHRKFYELLNTPLESLDDTFQKTDQTPMSIAFDNVLREQYRLFQSQLELTEKQQEEHRKFIN